MNLTVTHSGRAHKHFIILLWMFGKFIQRELDASPKAHPCTHDISFYYSAFWISDICACALPAPSSHSHSFHRMQLRTFHKLAVIIPYLGFIRCDGCPEPFYHWILRSMSHSLRRTELSSGKLNLWRSLRELNSSVTIYPAICIIQSCFEILVQVSMSFLCIFFLSEIYINL